MTFTTHGVYRFAEVLCFADTPRHFLALAMTNGLHLES